MKKKQVFLLKFSRLVGYRNGPFVWYVEAEDIEHIEPAAQDVVNELLVGEQEQHMVTYEPLSNKGQVQYGLVGDFEVAPQ